MREETSFIWMKPTRHRYPGDEIPTEAVEFHFITFDEISCKLRRTRFSVPPPLPAFPFLFHANSLNPQHYISISFQSGWSKFFRWAVDLHRQAGGVGDIGEPSPVLVPRVAGRHQQLEVLATALDNVVARS